MSLYGADGRFLAGVGSRFDPVMTNAIERNHIVRILDYNKRVHLDPFTGAAGFKRNSHHLHLITMFSYLVLPRPDPATTKTYCYSTTDDMLWYILNN
ncbi:protein of unknown function [Limnospira indica PCC 8005]|uniref:Uncharacterized protein n=1 Tax=Limnospira indica PCC 8005 TaxID=376219 RepID=A0A9P1KLS6_9CYAN|nr:protein of unknown function [Limnospira indica PCC 8005]